MDAFKDMALRAARFAGEVAAETLWPTRCAICDALGEVLCPRCAAELPYIDWWRACPRCGSPFGRVQCDVCNPVTLDHIGRDALPFASCASAVLYDDDTGRLVRAYKDQGEQRLADAMAEMMVRVVPPAWAFDAVTFVPATKAALHRRGFDHAGLVARGVACRVGAPCLETLARPRTRDQRALSGRQRVANLAGRFRALDAFQPDGRLLLVDDVYTTGSTLCSAADALLRKGCEEVVCLTFARV